MSEPAQDTSAVKDTVGDGDHGRSRWRFLYSNDFFTITPFTGWAFVYAAKTAKEIVFWYVVILLFLCFTIYNVNQLISYHASKPTVNKVLLQSSTKDMFLPNMTIELKVPLEMLLQKLPIDLTLNGSMPASQGDWSSELSPEGNDRLRIIHDYFCREHEWDGVFPHHSEAQFLQALQKDIEPLPHLLVLDVMGAKKISLSDPAVFDDWTKKINNSKRALKTIWDEIMWTPSDEQDRNAILEQMNEITSELVKDQASDIIYKLLVLEALKTDSKGNVKEILSKLKVPPLHFVTKSLSQLTDILHIKTDPDPKVSLLVDWTMTSGAAMRLFGIFKIFLVPHETKSMQLKLYFFVDMWLKEVIAALKETLVSGMGDDDDDDWMLSLQCGDGSTFHSLFLSLENLLYDEFQSKIDLALQVGFEQMKEVRRSALDLEIKPVIHFISQTADCINGTMQQCMDDCLSSHYFNHCGCIPWTLAYIQPTIKICDEFCDIEEQEKCVEECDNTFNHPCDVLLTETTHKTTPKGQIPDEKEMETISLNIAIPEMFVFANFIEDYELTTTAFMSRLGGALELWSGINILGVVHLVIFMAMTIMHMHSQISETSADSIDAVENEINQAIDELDFKHDSNNTSTSNVLSWLSGNELYEQTPMSGYAFIMSADTILEKVFWYIVICCLLILGAYNIHDSFKIYSTKPVRTKLFPSTHLGSFSLPNITIDIGLPLVQLGSFNISTRYDRSTSYSFDELYDLFDDFSTTNGDITDTLLNEWHEALEKSNFVPHSVPATLFDSNVLDTWEQSLLSGRGTLDEFKLQQANIEQIQKLLPQLIEAPLQNVADKSLLLKLLSLASMKHGFKFGQLIPTMHPSSLVGKVDSPNDLLKKQGWTAKELLEDTVSSLSNMFHVSLSHQNATAKLSDCSIDPDIQSVPPDSDSGRIFTIQMQIHIPIGVQELEVEIHSFTHLWLSAVDDWIQSINVNEDLDLFFVGNMMASHVRGVLFDYYRTTLHLQSPLTNQRYLVWGGSHMEANMKPSWQLTSKTNECSHLSTEFCTERCLIEAHLLQCDCIPWYMSSLNEDPDATICIEPCSEVQLEPCSNNCNNPCDLQMFDMTAPVEKDFDLSQQLLKFHLRIPSVLYPHLVQDYEISGSEFLSNLGAHLDFWLGINVLAVMHILVYILKQLFHWIHKDNGKIGEKDLENKIEKLKNIRTDIVSKINKLRETELTKASEQHRKKSALGWLWRHKFYEETNMSGFAFIPAAKRRSEGVLWWLLIIMFFIFTVYNIRNAFISYGRKPTQTVVSFSADTEPVEFGNFTLNVVNLGTFKW